MTQFLTNQAGMIKKYIWIGALLGLRVLENGEAQSGAPAAAKVLPRGI